MRRLVFALMACMICSSALAADQAVPPPPGAAAPSSPTGEKPSDDSKLDLQTPESEASKPDESWWQKLIRAAPNCRVFTDGCRTCSHTVCSNIGIACQPKEWVCSDTDPKTMPEAKPDAAPDAKK